MRCRAVAKICTGVVFSSVRSCLKNKVKLLQWEFVRVAVGYKFVRINWVNYIFKFVWSSCTSTVAPSKISYTWQICSLVFRWRNCCEAQLGLCDLKVSIASPIIVSGVVWDPWSQLTSQNVLRGSGSPLVVFSADFFSSDFQGVIFEDKCTYFSGLANQNWNYFWTFISPKIRPLLSRWQSNENWFSQFSHLEVFHLFQKLDFSHNCEKRFHYCLIADFYRKGALSYAAFYPYWSIFTGVARLSSSIMRIWPYLLHFL